MSLNINVHTQLYNHHHLDSTMNNLDILSIFRVPSFSFLNCRYKYPEAASFKFVIICALSHGLKCGHMGVQMDISVALFGTQCSVI